MKLVKKLFKWLLYILLIPVTYGIVSLILTTITVNGKADDTVLDKTIYLNTNGVHLDIVIPKKELDNLFLSDIKHNTTEHYLAFGWGDENFYLNTPTWDDLTFSTAFKAMFLKSTTLVHVTRYRQKHPDWVEVNLSASELQKLNTYLLNTFETDENGMKTILKNKGYTIIDDFYRAKGSYSCFNTCNSWVNTAFKQSGLKACLWTPFDFGLMNKYK
ncbi:DUF2459 domain-containing protein [Seonamhaeicola sp.]|uniref:DUF2459 domain-containing protein n=1 Tax=Seonamhaeicola sp. TaxID=1912245 RepID=UPI00262B98BE|nr:DUF2459 domain-containing protein [Seonamhaeicola sp.]